MITGAKISSLKCHKNYYRFFFIDVESGMQNMAKKLSASNEVRPVTL